MLKIVTYNMRQDTSHDGKQAFSFRKPYVLDRLKSESPDIVGFQEVLPRMLDWLRENLDGYEIFGYGRGCDFGDEACPVAIKRGRFELQYFDQRWLSETPFIPGSRFSDQSGCPRVFTVCKLRDRKQNGAGRFYFLNTHLDHEREYAKTEGAKLIKSELENLCSRSALPVIITGDFNALPGSAPVSVFTDSGYVDCTAGSGGTFHGYGKISKDNKIDYIMASAGAVCTGLRMWTETRGGLFLSDHYPVEVTLKSWEN